MKKQLEHYLISDQQFRLILTTFEYYTERVDNIESFFTGYSNKNTIYYDDKTIIIQSYRLDYLNIEFNDGVKDAWKQVILKTNPDSSGYVLEKDFSGPVAKAIVTKELLKYYDENEIDDILRSYKNEFDPSLAQQHIVSAIPMGLTKFTNCTYYDINGAHNDALTEMFPKAKDYFIRMFNERKVKPVNKKIINYYVGMLQDKKDKKTKQIKEKRYSGAYNYIVQRTTKKLSKLELQEQNDDSYIVYSNTDGVIIQNANGIEKHSSELGEFKIEAKGDVYTYRDENYCIIQYTKPNGEVEVKSVSGFFNELKDKINLYEGKVVHFTRKLDQFKHYQPINVTEEIIKEIKQW